MRTLKIATILLFILSAFALIAAPPGHWIAALKSALAEPRQKGTDPKVDPARYVGSDSCAQCHADQAARYALTAHQKTKVVAEKSNVATNLVGCEACHGGAKLHVEYYTKAQQLIKDGKDTEAQALYADTAKAAEAAMRSFSKLSPTEASNVCLKCHEGTQGRSEERFNFRRSEHFRHGVSCLDCHSSHSPKRTEFLLRNSQPDACYACHQDQKASFAKPFHHKVPEGGIKCSDCHNQHGGFQAKQLRSWAGGENACLKCHTDKAGPFAFEHAPIKVEGCQACHTPHGSSNPKLLKRNELRFLCLECHSNAPGIPVEGTGVGPPTPSFHDITQPRIQNCANCHLAIHGSNIDPFLRR